VEYWFNNDVSHIYLDLAWDNKKGYYKKVKKVPKGQTGTFRYILHANDSAGNQIDSSQTNLYLSDILAPNFGNETTPSTATTGDLFNFTINVTDNLDVTVIELVYKFGIGGTESTEPMNGTGPTYWRTIPVPGNSLDSIFYYYYTEDAEANTNSTSWQNITVIDNDKPVFGIDGTPVTANTWSSIQFSINVTDNIGLVEVRVEYWQVSWWVSNKTMTGPSPYTRDKTIYSSTKILYYFFYAVDAAGNMHVTDVKGVIINDKEQPIFGPDTSDTNGTTGEQFTFMVNVTDNVGVTVSMVEYWFGAGTHYNWSMNETAGNYSLIIDVPAGSADNLHYYFYFDDANNNWNISSVTHTPIDDNDNPIYGADSTPATVTTGENITFNINVTDNIGMNSVWVEYWFGWGIHYNWSMNLTTDWTVVVDIPANSELDLHYRFHANDSAGNWKHTSTKTVIVDDDDMPVFGVNNTPANSTTGEAVTFDIAVTDNIGINSVWVEYWFGSAGTHYNWSMNLTGSWKLVLDIPLNSELDLHYIFHANDSEGNWNQTPEGVVVINDNDEPNFGSDWTASFGWDPLQLVHEPHGHVDPDHRRSARLRAGPALHIPRQRFFRQLELDHPAEHPDLRQ
jgi:hypothetical protein